MKGRPSKRVQESDDGGDVLSGLPPCPRDLNPAAKACWKRIVNTVGKYRKINKADWALLKMYCITYARWEDAESQIESTGGTVLVGMKEDKDGNRVPSGGLYQNPFLSVAKGALAELLVMGKKLGLEPPGREALGIKTTEEKKGVQRRDRSKSSLPPPAIAGKVG